MCSLVSVEWGCEWIDKDEMNIAIIKRKKSVLWMRGNVLLAFHFWFLSRWL